MKKSAINDLGDELYQALRDRDSVEPLSERVSDVSIGDAYAISSRFLERRLDDGEKLIGRKIGLTNRVVQKYLGTEEPDFGNLTDAMQYANGAQVPISEELIQPKVEGEIAFVLK